MRAIRFIILTLLLTLSVAAQAQDTTEAAQDFHHDFLFVAIDPRTEDTAQNSDIYLIHSDGSGIVNLTDTELDSENHAVWSADGTQIYFSRNSVARDPGYDEEISSTSFYVMEVSPEGEKIGERLLFHLSDVFNRSMRVEDWTLSPDEETIVFGPYAEPPIEEESLSLYFASLDGVSIRRLVLNDGIGWYSDERGQWSPDGHELAYPRPVCSEGGSCHSEYFIVQPDSLTQPQQVGSEGDLLARWQPGEVVVYTDAPDIVVATAGEEEPLLVIDEELPTFMPALSPDWSTVVYSRYDGEEGTSTLMSMPVNGSAEAEPLTSPLEGGIWTPKWSPDGQQILFVVRPSGAFDVIVYVVNADGTNLTELYRASVWNFDEFAWRPAVG